MMMHRTTLPVVMLLSAILTFCLPGTIGAQTVVERIQVAPGPEDMVLDTSQMGPRLIISCCGRREVHKPFGGIISLNLITGKQFLMERLGEPEGILFRPHGIYLDGDLLYVISHEKEPETHPVLVYRVDGNQLHFAYLIDTPRQHSPNALVSGPEGEIYLVNDSGKRGSLWEKALKLKRASVEKLEKNKEGKWTAETVATGLGYPAGINRMGDQLYVGDAVLHRIHPYLITADGLVPTGEIKGLKGNDNIRIYENQLLVPGHVKPLNFIRHAKSAEKLSPVDVFLVDPETGSHRILYSTEGETISGASTAIIYGNYLYLSQVFDPWILKVELYP